MPWLLEKICGIYMPMDTRVAIREAVMASEDILRAVRGNMHTNTRVIMVADLKSEVKFDY